MLNRRNRHNRLSTDINAGSMADIAFLLLIFFLVTSQLKSDKGILVKLPAYNQESSTEDVVDPRNVLEVKVLTDGSLLIRDKAINFTDLNDQIKDFVTNPTSSVNLAATPKDAVISFSHEPATLYENFIKVYNAIQASYHEMRNDLALNKFSKELRFLSEQEREVIRTSIPIVISEVDPQ